MGASRTYYFEFVQPIAANTSFFPNLLNKFENELAMHYYKFFKYNLGLVNKVVGIIQFKERVGKTKLERIGADYNLLFELQPVSHPMVIPYLCIRLLCEHHNCCLESDIYVHGTFSFGGHGRSVESMMRPYIILLNSFKLSGDIGDAMLLEDGAKICMYADALERLPYDAI
jgi:hypothetical protein